MFLKCIRFWLLSMDSAAADLTTIFHCVWCLSPSSYRTSKLLPCMHSICQNCYTTFLTSNFHYQFKKNEKHISLQTDQRVRCIQCNFQSELQDVQDNFIVDFFDKGNPFPKRLTFKLHINLNILYIFTTKFFQMSQLRC